MLLLAFLAGCVTNEGLEERIDRDQDGYVDHLGGGDDCDDSDATVHPAAAEVCRDDIDNNCDGVVDDDGVGAGTWYWDADSDGVGAAPVSACSQPEGSVSTGSDCDDGDPGRYPGNAERCDDADNDCDSSIDEGLPEQEYWRDADGDGFGVVGESTIGCEVPVGFSGDGTDCDDEDSSVHPHADEVCNDSVDNNCDGLGCECRGADALLDVADVALALDGNPLSVQVADVDADDELDLLVQYPGRISWLKGPYPFRPEGDLVEAPGNSMCITEDSSGAGPELFVGDYYTAGTYNGSVTSYLATELVDGEEGFLARFEGASGTSTGDAVLCGASGGNLLVRDALGPASWRAFTADPIAVLHDLDGVSGSSLVASGRQGAVLSSSTTPHSLVIYPWVGGASSQSILAQGGSIVTLSSRLRDLDSDGEADMAIASLEGGEVNIRIVQSLFSGSLATGLPIEQPSSTSQVVDLAVGDRSGDGSASVAAATWSESGYSLSQWPASLLGAGPADKECELSLPGTAGLGETVLELRDFDQDGRDDLLWLERRAGGSASVLIRLGRGL